jgi:uncharacterized protein YndB with AHSA1/START domain
MSGHEFHLDREVFIRAQRSTVWKYFSDSERFARWWGAGSRIEPRVGGAMTIRYPNGDSVSGQVQEIVEGERIVFSYGYDQPGKPFGPGATRVQFELRDRAAGTLLSLRHTFSDAANRELHVDGWRYQLATFAHIVCEEQHAALPQVLGNWMSAWNEADADARSRALAACASESVQFVDRYGSATSRAELAALISNARKFLPVQLRFFGKARQTSGVALAEWEAVGPDGKVMMRGTNVFDLSGDGKIERAVGVGM